LLETASGEIIAAGYTVCLELPLESTVKELDSEFASNKISAFYSVCGGVSNWYEKIKCAFTRFGNNHAFFDPRPSNNAAQYECELSSLIMLGVDVMTNLRHRGMFMRLFSLAQEKKGKLLVVVGSSHINYLQSTFAQHGVPTKVMAAFCNPASVKYSDDVIGLPADEDNIGTSLEKFCKVISPQKMPKPSIS